MQLECTLVTTQLKVLFLCLFIALNFLLSGCGHTIHLPGFTKKPQPKTGLKYEYGKTSLLAIGDTPLIIALHGAAGASNQMLTGLRYFDKPVRIVAPDGPFAYNGGKVWFRSRQDAIETTEALRGFINQMVKKYSALGKPILVGYSQGAVMAYLMACRYPELFSYVIPIAGHMDYPMFKHLSCHGHQHTPQIFALNGKKDGVMRIEKALETQAFFIKQGYDAELISFPNAGHSLKGPLQSGVFEQLNYIVDKMHAGIERERR